MKRFSLVIVLLILSAQVFLFAQEKKERATVVEEVVLPELNVVNNILYIKNAPVGAKVEIITIVGNKVCRIEMKSQEGIYELNLPKAIYIFKLEGVVRKFVIR
ncbi:MAG: T9SS type A sorting domain-containing protein [Dysgonamonadaceae bacterium]|jgi:hypothetical protein|nr:T9SS type A sorting domain-containing protein [Dysgonamonadaceae bacterium]